MAYWRDYHIKRRRGEIEAHRKRVSALMGPLRRCPDKTPEALVSAAFPKGPGPMLALVLHRLGYPGQDALQVAKGEALLDYGEHDPDDCRKRPDLRNRAAVVLDYCIEHCTPYAGT